MYLLINIIRLDVIKSIIYFYSIIIHYIFIPLPVDSVRLRRQSGVHLEPAIQGGGPEAGGPHGHGALHCVPSHGEHHRLGRPGERQNHQTLEV